MSLEKVSAFMQALAAAYFIWMGYEAQNTRQKTEDFVVAAFLITSLAFLLVKLWRTPSPKASESEGATDADSADYQQLFLDENLSREKCQDQLVQIREERDQCRIELEQLKAQKPDTSLKESDPKIEIKIADLRGKTILKEPHEQACFDLINRGKQSPAMFFCIEDFQIGGYRVAFRNFPTPIAPFGNHDSVYPLYINNPDGSLCDQDMFTVFFYAWDDLHNRKKYEHTVPIRATYQDEARNLFEIRCDLVFYPQEHVNHQNPQLTGGTSSVILEAKNQKIRKVSAATTPVNWSV
jgi:hypothetical protein